MARMPSVGREPMADGAATVGRDAHIAPAFDHSCFGFALSITA